MNAFLPGGPVFGALVNRGEPTADEFTNRQGVRIWKQSHYAVYYIYYGIERAFSRGKSHHNRGMTL
jgi:hypothetical protein